MSGRHLTLTGFYAGAPICGATEKTPNDAHAVYAPLHLPDYRAACCNECLKEYAMSFEEDELATAPDWVREIRHER